MLRFALEARNLNRAFGRAISKLEWIGSRA
jgi:hypothetical protein